jgi:thiol-disulfide isomerase/thioredoxin
MKTENNIALSINSQGWRSNKELISLLLLVTFLFSAAPPPAQAQTFDLSAYKGKVVYLDFWASWCGPCRQSFPWMDRLLSLYSADGLVVVAANLDHDHDLALNFLHSFRHKFPIVYDPAGGLANDYHVKAMPTAFIIGRDGQILSTHSGFFEDQENQYLAEIRSALGQKAP